MNVGFVCLDINECRVNNGGCSDDCFNTHGSFECICPEGFQVAEDRRACIGGYACLSYYTPQAVYG